MAEAEAKPERRKRELPAEKEWVCVKRVGAFADKNARFRRSMEDEHIAVDEFGGIASQGYFGVYDGHGGRQVVEYVKAHLHEHMLSALADDPKDVPGAWKKAYLRTDEDLNEQKIMFSGTTVATALVRVENEDDTPVRQQPSSSDNNDDEKQDEDASEQNADQKDEKDENEESDSSSSASASSSSTSTTLSAGQKRMVYAANAGDARVVLVKGGVAERMTVDHKASDPDEVKRITDAGGFVMMNRVNGMLAVTRAIGDLTMKDYVTGEPYTQQAELTDEHTHLIIACDGVWDVFSDQEAADIVLKHTDHLLRCARILVRESIKKGSTDNISVMIVEL
jgi:protein phosphatase PTC1